MSAQSKKTTPPSEYDLLKVRLEALYLDARHNEQILKKFQQLELKLLGCSSLAELMQIIIHQSRSAFGWDTLTIILHDPDETIAHLLIESGDDLKRYESLVFTPDVSRIKKLYRHPPKPTLGPFKAAEHKELFNAISKRPRSIALLPLQRNSKLLGSLNLGSYQSDRFSSRNATDFLEHLAAVLATCLHTSIAHEKLRQAGLTDSLTGINNRRFFDQRLEEEISRNMRMASNLSCLYIDIDFFKVINDSHGHKVGDIVLRKVAELIRAQLRSIDVVCRYGGEEFTILLGQSGHEKAIEVAERIRSIIADTPFKEKNITANITVSIGVSTIMFDNARDDNIEVIGQELLQRADKALYKAKQNGRDQVIYLAN